MLTHCWIFSRLSLFSLSSDYDDDEDTPYAQMRCSSACRRGHALIPVPLLSYHPPATFPVSTPDLQHGASCGAPVRVLIREGSGKEKRAACLTRDVWLM